ncbi:Uncharacterised protein [Vibrio cholerae]|nr:Uncharacterised protein [Vibrio cholerae]
MVVEHPPRVKFRSPCLCSQTHKQRSSIRYCQPSYAQRTFVHG